MYIKQRVCGYLKWYWRCVDLRKVLLVDDDPKSRMGIKMILLRSESEFKDIQECSDGIEAQEKLRLENFDLVITDMKMPKMDGIRFIKNSQELKSKPKFLILSGYKDFGFASEALKYGVKDYLLKPIGRKDLIAAIDRIEAELSIEEVQLSKNSTMLRSLRVKEINFILMNETITEVEIRNILDNLMIYIFNREFHIYYLMQKDMKYLNSHKSIVETNLCFIVNNYFKNSLNSVMTVNDTNGNVVIISKEELRLEDLLTHISTVDKREHVIGVGGKGTSINEIRKVYVQAIEAIKYKIFKAYSSIIYYSDIERLSKEYQIPINKIRKIPEVIGTKTYKDIDILLDDIYDEEFLTINNIGYTEKLAEYIYNYIYQYFTEHFSAKFTSFEENKRSLKSIHNFINLKEYICELKDYIKVLDCEIIKLAENHDENVEIALQYIDDNYKKDIDLCMVSNYVSLSYSYFSSVFRKETGMKFVDYLNKLRIDKAKIMLCTKEHKIIEVAGKVGFTNPKHFTKIFKAATGVSPLEYRRKAYLYSSEEN